MDVVTLIVDRYRTKTVLLCYSWKVVIVFFLFFADLLDADGLSEDAVLVLLLQLTEHSSQQDVEGGQLDLQHRLLLLHLTGKKT